MSFEIVTENDYGHRIEAKVEDYDPVEDVISAVDLSTFHTKEFLILKPDKTEVTILGQNLSDGTDGWMYTDISMGSGVFNQNGYYKIRARIWSNTQRFTSNAFGFEVKPE